MLIIWYNYEIIQLQKGLNIRTSGEIMKILNSGSLVRFRCFDIFFMISLKKTDFIMSLVAQVSNVAQGPLVDKMLIHLPLLYSVYIN